MLCIVSTQHKLIKLTQKNTILTQKHVRHGLNEKCSLIGSCIYTQGPQLVALHVEVIELLKWDVSRGNGSLGWDFDSYRLAPLPGGYLCFFYVVDIWFLIFLLWTPVALPSCHYGIFHRNTSFSCLWSWYFMTEMKVNNRH